MTQRTPAKKSPKAKQPDPVVEAPETVTETEETVVEAPETETKTEEPVAEKEQGPEMIQAVMLTTFGVLGKMGEVVTLPENEAKQLADHGIVDLHPDAVKNAKA